MAVLPVFSAITLVRFAIVGALDPLTTAGVYWTQAPSSAVRPMVIIQSQDSGGRGEAHLNGLGWSGLITVKALADTLPAAEALLATVAPGMAAVVAPANYDMAVEYVRPIVIPPLDNVWQVGHVWRVSLERE